jgi:uncharacterized repeat protein (TIGR03803 family)
VAIRVRGWISRMRSGTSGISLGVALTLALGVVATSAPAQTFRVLYTFRGSPDGQWPYAGVIRNTHGDLYGTTYFGGSSNDGTVFRVNTTRHDTVIYGFAGGTADGEYPTGCLLRDKAGDLYGTTTVGGAYGDGVAFKVDAEGRETVLHSFAGGTTDGCLPSGGLTEDKSGNFYGTTLECGAFGYGTVFKIDKGGAETVVHSFAGGRSDGRNPSLSGLLIDEKANLYGVTEYGGGTGCGGDTGCGTVYKLDASGKLTVLYAFSGGATDGCFPFGTPIINNKGVIYGTTSQCGSSNEGQIWELSKTGVETVLHNFSNGSDGEYPLAGVVLDSKGNIYGDTEYGGPFGGGVVYKLSKSGVLTPLHNFGSQGGDNLIGGLIRDKSNNLYGTAVQGGNGGDGTVWKLTP